MWKNHPPTNRKENVRRIFDQYALASATLPVAGLLQFLSEEQQEPTANEDLAESLIDLYETDERAKESRCMTFDGFVRFMESNHCNAFNQAHTEVYQDMDQPLTSYFISSSHNTYLTGTQLVGCVEVEAYVFALRKGCRYLEINCWDGDNMEPVVWNGHTLTNKILFKDVISTIEQFAFEVSAYPVILSLENHCCKEQQEVMAHHLVSILGDKLLSAPLDQPTTGKLPSPNDLKYKTLIKTKKLKQRHEEAEEEDEKEGEVVEALSDLVVYTRSVQFISFSHSRDNQNIYENASLSELEGRSLIKTSGEDFVRHNQRFLSRIDSEPSMTVSSNYNPQMFWNVGSQLVALNFQTEDLGMDLNDGRFQDNGGCGYILKPDVLTSSRCFDPGWQSFNVQPTKLLLKVISGSNFGVGSGSLDCFVQLQIHGVARDNCEQRTDSVKTYWSPSWDETMNFTITIPELALIRICVRQWTNYSSTLCAQYTLPLLSLKKGYRWLPFRNLLAYNATPALLYVFVFCFLKQLSH